jgi:hypothetical protein
MFLGHFATFDAPSFTAIIWAMALGVWSSRRGRSVAWSLLVGVLCGLAVLLKYSSAIDVPFVMMLTLLGWSLRDGPKRALIRGILAGATCLAMLVGSALTWANGLLAGVAFSTTDRHSFVSADTLHLLHLVAGWAGLTYTLMIGGGVYLARRQPVLAMLLLFGSVAAPAYQIHMGEEISLHKHLALGVIFGAPLAGVLLSGLSRRRFGALLVALLMWVGFVSGLTQSKLLFTLWPNTDVLARQIEYSVDSMPGIRMMGDNPEPLEYALRDKAHAGQWTATYSNSFYYKGLRDLPAYEAALKDNYFQLVFLDGSSSTSQALMHEIESYGFKKTSEVRRPYTGQGWKVYQRFDDIPE